MRSYDEAQNRIPSQIEKIVSRLREAGEDGLTSADLSEICLRYGARLSELYMRGYRIENEHVGKGLYKYVLKKVPSELTYFPNATDEIIYTIENEFNGTITTEQLIYLLDSKYFHITRKPNWYKQKMKIN